MSSYLVLVHLFISFSESLVILRGIYLNLFSFWRLTLACDICGIFTSRGWKLSSKHHPALPQNSDSASDCAMMSFKVAVSIRHQSAKPYCRFEFMTARSNYYTMLIRKEFCGKFCEVWKFGVTIFLCIYLNIYNWIHECSRTLWKRASLLCVHL